MLTTRAWKTGVRLPLPPPNKRRKDAMKLNSNINKIETNSGAESVQMTIDKDGMSHIIHVLTNLYEDPEKTVIREYYSNAVDSHIAAGTDRKVDVTLPSIFNPVYSVQDYGVGLSEHELLTICSSYGKSTKRDSNSQIGAFGLGFKSALAYTSQFTVEAVKDGILTIATVGTSVDGSAEMSILATTETDKPNGVKVSIPIKGSVASFLNRAREFFQYVDEDYLNIVNEGFSVVNYKNTLTKIGDSAWVGSGSGYLNSNNLYILMGGVRYPVSNSIFNEAVAEFPLPRVPGIRINLTCDIGDVDLTPSRESIRDTPRTRSNILKMFEKFYDDLGETIVDIVKAEDNIVHGYIKLIKFLEESSFINAMTSFHDLSFLLGRYSVGGVNLGIIGGLPLTENEELKMFLHPHSICKSNLSHSGPRFIVENTSVGDNTFAKWIDRAVSAGVVDQKSDIRRYYDSVKLTEYAKILKFDVISYDEFKRMVKKEEKDLGLDNHSKPKSSTPVSPRMSSYSGAVIQGEDVEYVDLRTLEGSYYVFYSWINRYDFKDYVFLKKQTNVRMKSLFSCPAHVFVGSKVFERPTLIIPHWAKIPENAEFEVIDDITHVLDQDRAKEIIYSYTKSESKRNIMLSIIDKRSISSVLFDSHLMTDFFREAKLNDPVLKDFQKKLRKLNDEDFKLLKSFNGSYYVHKDNEISKIVGYIRKNYSMVADQILNTRYANEDTRGLEDIMRIIYTKRIKPSKESKNV